MSRFTPYCYYCKRHLIDARKLQATSYTRDHVIPQAMGGRKTVPCCRSCNTLKDDIMPSGWFWFIRTYPDYWRVGTWTTRSVRMAIACGAPR